MTMRRFYAVAILVGLTALSGAQLRAQQNLMARGQIKRVTNGTLTLISDRPFCCRVGQMGAAAWHKKGEELELAVDSSTYIEVLLTPEPGARPASASDMYKYKRAVVLYKPGARNHASKISLYEPSTPVPPGEDAQIYFQRALELQDHGELTQAIAEYHRGISLNPNIPAAHNNLGNALAQQGKYEEAISEYQAAIDLQLNYAIAHKNLANALERKGDRQEAAQQNQLACAFDPGTFCPSAQQTCRRVEVRLQGRSVPMTTACVPLQVWNYCVTKAKGIERECVMGWISNPNGLDPTSVYQFKPPH